MWYEDAKPCYRLASLNDICHNTACSRRVYTPYMQQDVSVQQHGTYFRGSSHEVYFYTVSCQFSEISISLRGKFGPFDRLIPLPKSSSIGCFFGSGSVAKVFPGVLFVSI